MVDTAEWRTFRTDAPEEIVPVYDFLQEHLDSILADKVLTGKIMNINTGLRKGDYYKQLRLILSDDYKTWDLGANAQYMRIIHENIRRLMVSLSDKITIQEVLIANDNQATEDVYESLHAQNNYPKAGTVRNIQKMIEKGERIKVPAHVKLQLDYSIVDDKSIVRRLEKRRYLLRLSKKRWLDIGVSLPASIRKEATGVIARPKFVKDDEGITRCYISYKIQSQQVSRTGKRLGVDIGKIKPACCVAVSEDGKVSQELGLSKRTLRIAGKLKRLNDSLDALYDKINRVNAYKLENPVRQAARLDEAACLRAKRSRLKAALARLIAVDVVSIAEREGCSSIHVENLSWLDALGGKWDHAQVQRFIEELCVVRGLAFVKVNAAFSSCEAPWSGEHGVERERVIVFEDGTVLDRDYLGALNVAVREGVRGSRSKRVSVSCGEVVRRGSQSCVGVGARSRYSRSCRGFMAGSDRFDNIDYCSVLGRFCGGVEIVAFSTGQGYSPSRAVILNGQARKTRGTKSLTGAPA